MGVVSLISVEYSLTLSFKYLSCIFLSALDLSSTFVVIPMMKAVNFFHFCILFFLFLFFLRPKNMFSCPEVQSQLLPVVCQRDLVSLFLLSPKTTWSVFLLFSLHYFLFNFFFCTHIIKTKFISHSGNLPFFSFSKGLHQGQ